MTGDSRDGRVARIYVVAIVDPPGVLTQVRIEQRDWMDRLLTRAQMSPLTDGGDDGTISRATALFWQLVTDARVELEAQND